MDIGENRWKANSPLFLSIWFDVFSECFSEKRVKVSISISLSLNLFLTQLLVELFCIKHLSRRTDGHNLFVHMKNRITWITCNFSLSSFRFDFFSLDDHHLIAIAQGPLGDATSRGDKSGGSVVGRRGGGGRTQGPPEESITSLVAKSLPATKCLFVPLRNLCKPLCRQKIDRMFPQTQGTFQEEFIIDSDDIRARNENCMFKIDCEKENCFTVCSVI